MNAVSCWQSFPAPAAISPPGACSWVDSTHGGKTLPAAATKSGERVKPTMPLATDKIIALVGNYGRIEISNNCHTYQFDAAKSGD
jgi:hypothetical protein